MDLLKIDVQRAEREVLEGIGDPEWGKIQQIVMEVHDEVDDVVKLLEGKGYVVAWEEGERLAGTGRYNVYARRGGLGDEAGRRAGQL